MKPILIQRGKITRVYSGRPGCACGCRGNYSSSKGSITKILKVYADTLASTIKEGGDDNMTSDGEHFVYWESPDGARAYTIYFKKEGGRTGMKPLYLHKSGSEMRAEVILHYVEKFQQKMQGASADTARGWVIGTNAMTTAQEKRQIWKRIQTFIKGA